MGIAERLASLRDELGNLAADAGRDPTTVKLVAVSKTQPPEALLAAYAAGQRLFGENRVQELVAKYEQLPDDFQWHLIGHLQRNKARLAVQTVDLVHSVDSVALIERLSRLSGEFQQVQSVLLQINVSGEESKEGVAPYQAPPLLEAAINAPSAACCGLMTMAPFGADEATLRQVFGGLRQLRDRLEDQYGCGLPELSMGMSSDYRIAVAEGATLVRIGTAIFGERAR